MDIETLRTYCLSFKGAEEKTPFDEDTLVFSVRGKMFCLADISSFEFINLKCEPETATALREQYEDVTPGYHMNKNHWNSVKANGRISDTQLKEWIKDSYNLVVEGLPKKVQNELKQG